MRCIEPISEIAPQRRESVLMVAVVGVTHAFGFEPSGSLRVVGDASMAIGLSRERQGGFRQSPTRPGVECTQGQVMGQCCDVQDLAAQVVAEAREKGLVEQQARLAGVQAH